MVVHKTTINIGVFPLTGNIRHIEIGWYRTGLDRQSPQESTSGL
jgi:hypothetical protein